MVLSARSRLTRAAWFALAVVAALAAIDGARTWRHEQLNAALVNGTLPDAAPGQPRELQFARAAAYAASGVHEDALNGFRTLQDATPLGQAAKFNTANALMRQAIALRATEQPGQAIPLVELAKETYRDVLRAEPRHWGARYNLERAQRLLPDPDDGDAPPAEAPTNAERAATTMRGYSPGLP